LINFHEVQGIIERELSKCDQFGNNPDQSTKEIWPIKHILLNCSVRGIDGMRSASLTYGLPYTHINVNIKPFIIHFINRDDLFRLGYVTACQRFPSRFPVIPCPLTGRRPFFKTWPSTTNWRAKSTTTTNDGASRTSSSSICGHRRPIGGRRVPQPPTTMLLEHHLLQLVATDDQLAGEEYHNHQRRRSSNTICFNMWQRMTT
jgi:hypothetical protein